jgi:hypothetical protein
MTFESCRIVTLNLSFYNGIWIRNLNQSRKDYFVQADFCITYLRSERAICYGAIVPKVLKITLVDGRYAIPSRKRDVLSVNLSYSKNFSHIGLA